MATQEAARRIYFHELEQLPDMTSRAKDRQVSKRHHKVPQFYLEGFRDPDSPGFLWVYEKGGSVPLLLPIKKTGAETHYYSAETPDGGHDDGLERGFLAVVEGRAAGIIRRWRELARPELLDEDIEPMTLFLAAMIVRSPRMRRMAEETLIAGVKGRVREKAKDLKYVRAFLRKNPDLQVTPEHLQDLAHGLLKGERFALKASKNHLLGLTFGQFLDVIPPIISHPWCLCLSSDDAEFVTSDSPASIFVPHPDGMALIGAGIGLPNAEITLPISPRVALHISDRERRRRRRVNQRFVREMNRRVACQAERYLYAARRAKRITSLVGEFAFTRTTPLVDQAEVWRRLQLQECEDDEE